MNSYDLGARIRAARLRLGMQQQDLAAHLQTTAATVSRYERGEHEPRPSDLVRLARVLSVPASYLLGETELITHDGTNDEIARRLAAMAPAEIGKRMSISGLRRLISIVSQGGAVGCQDPVAFWEGELRAIREMG